MGSPRVDKNVERKGRVGEVQVLRPVNNKRQLDRSNSLTKQEKTELNLKAQEKENLTSCVRSNQRSRVDVTKLRKKLSECKTGEYKDDILLEEPRTSLTMLLDFGSWCV